MPDFDHQRKLTIEDLLRLKKVERPAADFWVTFERELRQKQLSALVEKRPSWRDIPKYFVRRAYLPVGATAVLVFTLASFKLYHPAPTADSNPPPTASAIPAKADVQTLSIASAEISAPPLAVSSPLVNRSEPTEIVAEASEVRSSNAAAAAGLETMQPQFVPSSESSPSARSIAANYARLEQSEPELINSVLGTRLSAPARLRAAPSTPTVGLAALQTGTSKRTRLLARYNERQPVADLVAPDAVRERVSRRLGDSDFNDHFNRVGLKGDKVSLKF